MSRLAARIASPLLLLFLIGSYGWTEPAGSDAGAPPPAPPAAEAADGTEKKEKQDTGAAQAAPAPTAAKAQVAQAPAPGSPDAPPPAAPPAEPPAPNLTFGGFVDAYYEFNFNRPPRFINDGGLRVRNDPQNKLRNFDFRHNELALNMAELIIDRKATPVGLHLVLAAGKATDWVHAVEPGGAETYKHILQAYLTTPLKFWGKDDTLDVGKFVTHHGAEVIETKDNWNYTRSLLFAWAIPYYHAGLRYRHPLNPTSALTLFLYNGWNDVEDNNNALSYGLMYNAALGKKLSLVQNYTGGPELTDDNHNWRHLFDTVLTYNASDKMSYMLNFDYATEQRDGPDVSWKGLAFYARRALSSRNAFVLRGEWFSDDDGASTGTDQEVKEVTATYEMKNSGGLLTRLEFRYDWSNKDVFDSRSGGKKGNQATLLLGSVYAF